MIKTKTKQLISKMRLDAWQRLEYKHTATLLLILIVFVLALDTAIFTTVLALIISTGYAGAFVAGIFFVSLFTFAPASTAILILATTGLNPVIVALVAAAGAMVGDYIILRYVEEKVVYELKPIALKFGIPQLVSYFQDRKHTNWFMRAIGAFVIASPLPDEVGIGLLGISKIGNASFFTISYLLNAGGILVFVMLGNAII